MGKALEKEETIKRGKRGVSPIYLDDDAAPGPSNIIFL